jgi:NADH-quinone oxidoreductase subunit L
VAALGWLVGWFFYCRQNPAESEAMLKGRFHAIWTVLERKYYMDEIWAALVGATMFAGARACDWFDTSVLDGVIVNGVGRGVFSFGESLREEHSGKVQQYALMMLVALILIVVGVAVAEAPTWLTSFGPRPGGS